MVSNMLDLTIHLFSFQVALITSVDSEFPAYDDAAIIFIGTHGPLPCVCNRVVSSFCATIFVTNDASDSKGSYFVYDSVRTPSSML